MLTISVIKIYNVITRVYSLSNHGKHCNGHNFIEGYADDNKVAAVLVVTRERDYITAIKEAADLEKAFARAGYSILCYGDRENATKHPVTAATSHFYEVAKYVDAKKDELDGCFVFIL